MTSKLVVNTIEADTGISSVSFASSISMDSTSKFHFSAAGVDIGADTNINRPASGVIGFNINSSEKVRINSNGQLGIGTNNPTQLIEVQNRSTGTVCGLNVGTQYGNAHFGGYNNYPAIMNSGNQPLIYCDTNNDRTVLFGDTVGFGTTCAFRVNNAERLRITSTGAINLTSENTTGWQLDAGDNSASYTAIDNHFPTTNRTLYINNETTHRSIAFWNKNGSDGYGFGLDNSGNFKVVYGSSERLRLTQDGSTIALGLGIVPQSGQYNGWTVLQIGESAALTSNRTTGDTNQTELSNNSYLNSNASAYKYHHADEATRYVQSHGRHTWYTAPSGSADANISFTEVMKVDASGYVTKPTTAAFNVRGTNMVRTNTNAYTCTFDDDSGTGCYDSGNNFNTSTWKFTAPVSGHYYFFTNIRLDSFSSGYIRTAILSTSYHAGTAYYNIPSTGHVIDYYTSPTNILHISTSTVMYVPATHEVWVHQDPSSDSSYTAYLAESSFGGYLIG